MIIALVMLLLAGRVVYRFTHTKGKVARDNPFTAIKRNVAARNIKLKKK